MTTETSQPRNKKSSDFGLPQAEFKPVVEGGSKWLKITAIVVGIVLVIGAGAVYWLFFHNPAAEPSEETYTWHEAPAEELKQDTQTHELDKELDTLEEEQNAFSKHLTTKPEKGSITNVNTPHGCYYVVVGSFIDDDLASDYANRLAKQGVNVMLIMPAPSKDFYRVAVAQADTFYDANEKVEALKATYGKDIWVMKY